MNLQDFKELLERAQSNPTGPAEYGEALYQMVKSLDDLARLVASLEAEGRFKLWSPKDRRAIRTALEAIGYKE